MAQRAGVDSAVLRAIVARDYLAMPDEVVLAVRFAEATLHHAPDADELRQEVLRRWGERGLISLAFAMLSARMYPTLKYALGHGRACTRLVIGGEAPPVRREPGEKGNDNYRKLFFRQNRLVGVLMIGSPKGRKKLLELVKNQQVVETATEREALLTLK